jgi:hypothetical protein
VGSRMYGTVSLSRAMTRYPKRDQRQTTGDAVRRKKVKEDELSPSSVGVASSSPSIDALESWRPRPCHVRSCDIFNVT